MLGVNRTVWMAAVALVVASAAQEAPKNPPETRQQPQVRLTMINPCTPTEADQKELAAALRSLPQHPSFASDYEIARGHTTVPQAAPSDWVRIRKDFPENAAFLNSQYSMSVDEHGIEETLVLRPRDTKEILQVRIEDAVTVATPAAVAATDTPASRIRVERSGKSSLTLGRCVDVDQSAYEPLFKSASEVMARYRTLLGVRRIVPAEIARLGAGTARKEGAASPKKPAEKK